MNSIVMMMVVAAGLSEADSFFQKAREAMAAKRYADACGLFEKSHAAEPALGTLLNLADCYEKKGMPATAWVKFNEAAAWASRNKEAARETFATKRAGALKPGLQYLVVKLSKVPAGTRLSGDDGVSVDVVGPLSVPMNPGPKRFTIAAPGCVAQEHSFDFNKPGSSQVWDLTLVPSAPEPQAPLAQAPAETPATQSAPASVVPAPLGPTVVSAESPVKSKVVPGVITAIGAVVAGVGAAGLGYTYIRYDAVKRQQPGGPDANNPQVSKDEFNTMRTLYPLSWIAVGVGAAVTATGLFTLFYTPASPSPSVALVPLPGGMAASVGGTF